MASNPTINQVFTSRLKIDSAIIDKALEGYDIKKLKQHEVEEGLSDKQIKFCREYLRTFNITQAAINAGYSKATAHVKGSVLIRQLRCVRYICYMKYKYEQETFFDGLDMINKLTAIINADVTDYATFGQKEVIVKDRFGVPIIIDGKIQKEKQSFITLKDNSLVDGSLVQEIGWNKGGPYIKFYDKLKAMELLGQFSPTIRPNQTDIQIKKLELETEKVALQKAQFLYDMQKESKQAKDEIAILKLKERMDKRKKQNELNKNSDKRISDREVVQQAIEENNSDKPRDVEHSS